MSTQVSFPNSSADARLDYVFMLQILFFFTATSIFFSPHNETAKAAAIDSTKSYASSLRQLAPGTGAYMNEVKLITPLSGWIIGGSLRIY